MPPHNAAPDPEALGLCFTCRWKRALTSRRGSTFFRCARAETDPRFVRYPPLPARSCSGHEVAMLYGALNHYTPPLAALDAVRAKHLEHLDRYAREGACFRGASRAPPRGRALGAAAP